MTCVRAGSGKTKEKTPCIAGFVLAAHLAAHLNSGSLGLLVHMGLFLSNNLSLFSGMEQATLELLGKQHVGQASSRNVTMVDPAGTFHAMNGV